MPGRNQAHIVTSWNVLWNLPFFFYMMAQKTHSQAKQNMRAEFSFRPTPMSSNLDYGGKNVWTNFQLGVANFLIFFQTFCLPWGGKNGEEGSLIINTFHAKIPSGNIVSVVAITEIFSNQGFPLTRVILSVSVTLYPGVIIKIFKNWWG